MIRARRGENRATRALRKSGTVGLGAIVLLTLTISFPAFGAAQVTNGSFESNGGNGQVNYTTTLAGWSLNNPSYTFVFGPGTADTTGANGQYGFLALWGPGNGSANGLPTTSPDGGFYIAQDSAFQQNALYQTINGLTVGNGYTVGFWWAAAQQEYFYGATESQWQVSLGSQTQSTAFASIDSQGFSGWMYQTFNFTATTAAKYCRSSPTARRRFRRSRCLTA